MYEKILVVKDFCIEILIPFGITILIFDIAAYIRAKKKTANQVYEFVHTIHDYVKGNIDEEENKGPATVVKFEKQKGGDTDGK